MTRRTSFYLLPDPSPPCTTRIGCRFSANSRSARRSDFFFSRRFFRASGLRSNHWQRGHVSTLCAGFLRLQRRGVRPDLLTTMTLSEGLRAAARRSHKASVRHSQARCRCRPCRQSTRFSVWARIGHHRDQNSGPIRCRRRHRRSRRNGDGPRSHPGPSR